MILYTDDEIYQMLINLLNNKHCINVNQHNEDFLNKIPLPTLIKKLYKFIQYEMKTLFKVNWQLESLEDNIYFKNKYKYLLPIMNKYYKKRIYYVIFVVKYNPEFIYIGLEKFNNDLYIEKYQDLNPSSNMMINFNQFIIYNMNINYFKHQIDTEIL